MSAKLVWRVGFIFLCALNLPVRAESHVVFDAQGRPSLDPAVKSRLQQLVQTANACDLRLDPNLPNQVEADLIGRVNLPPLNGGFIAPPAVDAEAAADEGAGAGAGEGAGAGSPATGGFGGGAVDDSETSSATESVTDSAGGEDDEGADPALATLYPKCMKCHNGSAGPNFTNEAGLIAQIKAKPAAAIRMVNTKLKGQASSAEVAALQRFAMGQ